MRILLIGSGDSPEECECFKKAWGSMGHEVKFFSDTEIVDLMVEICGIEIARKRVNDHALTSILRKKEDSFKPDVIFLNYIKLSLYFGQTDDPQYLYVHEPLHLTHPVMSKLHGIFYAWDSAEAMFKMHNPHEYGQTKHHVFVPYGFNPEVYYDKGLKRDIDIGFMGATYQENGKFSKDYMTRHIYDTRNDVLSYLKMLSEIEKDRFDIRVERFSPLDKYTDFLNNCNFGINICSEVGAPNERIYQILASGAILLQWECEGLDNCGLVDHENCIIVRNKSEILEILFDYTKRPEIYESIRKEGLEFAKNNTYAKRAEFIIKNIERIEKK